MAEGNETFGGEPGGGEGRGRRGEGDLLAERRARRAAESGEAALTRRAEAAEATVQTLERHVSSLQQRLADAEDELAQMAESGKVSAPGSASSGPPKPNPVVALIDQARSLLPGLPPGLELPLYSSRLT